MTNREAINVLQKYTSDDTISPVVQEAHNMAIAALEKQEPKVPEEISWEYDYFKCPSCGKLITSTTRIDAHKYCLECGQALKFREDAE